MSYISYDPIFEREKHPFHLLPNSRLPYYTCLFLLVTLISLVLTLHNVPEFMFKFISRETVMHLSFAYLWATLFAWFNHITRESVVGHHTTKVQQGLKMGFVLFVVSEVMLFFAFFWSFFHFSLVPAISIGDIWPPYGSQVLDIWRLPFINTVLLLASGVAVTAAHKELLYPENDDQDYVNLVFRYDLICTLIFGFTFLLVQGIEYKYGVHFSWRGNVYGSIFFLTTGFHGMHVTVGALFLLYCYMRQYVSETFAWICFNYVHQRGKLYHYDWLKYGPFFMRTLHIHSLRLWGFSSDQHVGFETAAWYWHFVDVVWLFLFITVYWWGGSLADRVSY